MTTLRSSSKNSSTTGTAISVSAPSGATAGDIVLIFVHANTDTTIVDNNGSTPWTEDVNDYHPNPIHGHTVSVFSRRLVSGDPSTYNFTSGASGRWSILATAWKNPHPTRIYDVSPSTSNNSDADTATIDAPSITTLRDNAIHVCMGALDDGAITLSSYPSGYTAIDNTSNQPLGAAYKRITPVGATGAQTFTFSGASGCISVSLALADNSSVSNFFAFM